MLRRPGLFSDRILGSCSDQSDKRQAWWLIGRRIWGNTVVGRRHARRMLQPSRGRKGTTEEGFSWSRALGSIFRSRKCSKRRSRPFSRSRQIANSFSVSFWHLVQWHRSTMNPAQRETIMPPGMRKQTGQDREEKDQERSEDVM